MVEIFFPLYWESRTNVLFLKKKKNKRLTHWEFNDSKHQRTNKEWTSLFLKRYSNLCLHTNIFNINDDGIVY